MSRRHSLIWARLMTGFPSLACSLNCHVWGSRTPPYSGYLPFWQSDYRLWKLTDVNPNGKPPSPESLKAQFLGRFCWPCFYQWSTLIPPKWVLHFCRWYNRVYNRWYSHFNLLSALIGFSCSFIMGKDMGNALQCRKRANIYQLTQMAEVTLTWMVRLYHK